MILTFFWNIGDAIGVIFFTLLFLGWLFFAVKAWLKKKWAQVRSKFKPSDFVQNGIYKMAVASRSHVTQPYYVIVINIQPDFIRTYIPGHDHRTIKYPSPEWDYHTPRMTFVRVSDLNDDLLHNQKHLV